MSDGVTSNHPQLNLPWLHLTLFYYYFTISYNIVSTNIHYMLHNIPIVSLHDIMIYLYSRIVQKRTIIVNLINLIRLIDY